MVWVYGAKTNGRRQPDGSGIRSLGRIGGLDGSVNKGRHFPFPSTTGIR